MAIDFNNVFLINDQPTTCPECGRRTEILSEGIRAGVHTEIHRCPGEDCKFEFVAVEDAD